MFSSLFWGTVNGVHGSASDRGLCRARTLLYQVLCLEKLVVDVTGSGRVYAPSATQDHLARGMVSIAQRGAGCDMRQEVEISI